MVQIRYAPKITVQLSVCPLFHHQAQSVKRNRHRIKCLRRNPRARDLRAASPLCGDKHPFFRAGSSVSLMSLNLFILIKGH